MNISRRKFLKKSAQAAATGVLLAGTLKVENLFSKSLSESGKKDVNSVTKTINISDYPALSKVGGYAMITSTVILIRNSKTKFTALNITCTHKKCDVEYNGSKFECPCHGSMYSKSGKVLNGPAKKNLKKYSTSFDEDTGVVTINM